MEASEEGSMGYRVGPGRHTVRDGVAAETLKARVLANLRYTLQPLRQKAPWLAPGDDWRFHLPVSCTGVRRGLPHLANCILLGRSVGKRSHGEQPDRLVDGMLPGRREAKRAGASAPSNHLLTA